MPERGSTPSLIAANNQRYIQPDMAARLLTVWFKGQFKFGVLLGKIISPLVMGIIFFFVVTPTSFMMKIFNKDLLNLKKNDKDFYWITKSKIKSKMKNQF